MSRDQYDVRRQVEERRSSRRREYSKADVDKWVQARTDGIEPEDFKARFKITTLAASRIARRLNIKWPTFSNNKGKA